MRAAVIVLVSISACRYKSAPHGGADGSVADQGADTGSDSSADAQTDASPDASNPGPAPLAAISGTRLKVIRYVTADGTQQPDSDPTLFHDALLGRDCNVVRRSNGKSYCVPMRRNPDVLVYADDQCTMPIGAQFAEELCVGLPEDYARVFEQTPCDGPRLAHVYTRGASIPQNVPTWYETTSGCVANRVGQGSFGYYFGPDAPTSTFVEVTRIAHSSTGRLAGYAYSSADGLDAPIARAYDATLAADCAVGSPSCMPYGLGIGACGDAIATNGCPVPSYASDGTNAYAVGAVDPLCNSGPGDTAYHLGAQVTPVSVTRSYAAAPGQRLKPIELSGDGVTYHDSQLYDSAHSMECGVAQIGTGYSCGWYPSLPGPQCGDVHLLYTDSSCTQSAMFCATQGSAPATWAMQWIPTPDPSCQRPDYDFYSVSPTEHVGALFYKTSTTCEPSSFDFPPTTHWYDMTLTLSSQTDFAPMTRVVDP